AKEQSLSLNPTKLSGSCGRLMCCLKYESEAYQDLLKTTPKVGALVKTSEGRGTVIDVNLLTGVLKVKPDKSDNILTVKKDEVELLKDVVVKLDKNELRALRQLEGK
ncbi:MAG: stage 0 sporulation protein, partial [Ruminococcus sp.]|nr:stage 0 sporulation protein [Ruminococcus sp.]